MVTSMTANYMLCCGNNTRVLLLLTITGNKKTLFGESKCLCAKTKYSSLTAVLKHQISSRLFLFVDSYTKLDRKNKLI